MRLLPLQRHEARYHFQRLYLRRCSPIRDNFRGARRPRSTLATCWVYVDPGPAHAWDSQQTTSLNQKRPWDMSSSHLSHPPQSPRLTRYPPQTGLHRGVFAALGILTTLSALPEPYLMV